MPMACIASTLSIGSDDVILLKLLNKERRSGTISVGGHPERKLIL
jgi:hypothetical protein